MAKWIIETFSDTGSPDGDAREVHANGAVQAASKALGEKLVTVKGHGGRLRARASREGEPGTAPEMVYLYQPQPS